MNLYQLQQNFRAVRATKVGRAMNSMLILKSLLA